MPSLPPLDACPLCRSTLRTSADRCPDCGGVLRPFRDAHERAEAIVDLARDMLSQHRTEETEGLLRQLGKLTDLPPQLLLEFHTQLALAQGDLDKAQQLARQLGPEAAGTGLQEAVAAAVADRQLARELYNSALWAARQGAYARAAEELQRAVQYDPADARLWLLKIKAELKARLYSRCYKSLQALDRLHARPAELARLEALLPAVVQA